MNKSISRMESTGIEHPPLKLKLYVKHKLLKLNNLQCQCIVSGRSCGHSPYIFDIYIFFGGPQFEKNWLRKLRIIAKSSVFYGFEY